jgi:putative membrane protein
MAAALAWLVVALHAGFLVLEMFLWETPMGLRVFRQSAQDARRTAVLAKNQGLYNGFLAAGLAYGLCAKDPALREGMTRFLLGCVVVAGAYGALTLRSGRVFLLQGLPALLALLLR